MSKWNFLLKTVFILSVSGCGPTVKKLNDKVNVEKQADYTAKLDSLLQTTQPRIFNGIVLITENESIKYSKAFGFSDFEARKVLTLQDNFRIQSNTKQFTAVLVLKEVEKGRLKLGDPIKQYLPDMKQSWADTVTIEHLLNMSSGLVHLDKPLAFKPGTSFYYSNPAYGLLGRIIQKVTGRKYGDVVNDLFKEVGMHNTYCYVLNGDNPWLINGYWLSNDSISRVDFKTMNFTEETWDNFAPAGGIISNAIDLQIWDTKLHTGRILKNESYQAMMKSELKDPDYTFSDKPSFYGFGVNINESESAKYFGHTGRGIGFVSLKIYLPGRNLNLIVLENVYHRDNNIVYHFEKQIREIVMKSNLSK